MLSTSFLEPKTTGGIGIVSVDHIYDAPIHAHIHAASNPRYLNHFYYYDLIVASLLGPMSKKLTLSYTNTPSIVEVEIAAARTHTHTHLIDR